MYGVIMTVKNILDWNIKMKLLIQHLKNITMTIKIYIWKC